MADYYGASDAGPSRLMGAERPKLQNYDDSGSGESTLQPSELRFVWLGSAAKSVACMPYPFNPIPTHNHEWERRIQVYHTQTLGGAS